MSSVRLESQTVVFLARNATVINFPFVWPWAVLPWSPKPLLFLREMQIAKTGYRFSILFITFYIQMQRKKTAAHGCSWYSLQKLKPPPVMYTRDYSTPGVTRRMLRRARETSYKTRAEESLLENGIDKVHVTFQTAPAYLSSRGVWKYGAHV